MDIDFTFWVIVLTAISALCWALAKFAKAGIWRSALGKSFAPTVQFLAPLFPLLLIVTVVRSFIVEPFQIPSGSMFPTLHTGDFVLVNKFSYGIRLPILNTNLIEVGKPQRGEVVVFVPPHEDNYFVKRLIGLPGDLVEYKNKTLHVNGEALDMSFLSQRPAKAPEYRIYSEKIGDDNHALRQDLSAPAVDGAWKVPDGHYFMMGDNRDRSADSRSWGFVAEEKLVGSAFLIWMHKKPGWHLPNLSRVGKID